MGILFEKVYMLDISNMSLGSVSMEPVAYIYLDYTKVRNISMGPVTELRFSEVQTEIAILLYSP